MEIESWTEWQLISEQPHRKFKNWVKYVVMLVSNHHLTSFLRLLLLAPCPPTAMSLNTSYRPPPPAPSAFFAMQLAQSTVSNALPNPTSTPSAYLPRISSKTSLNVLSGGAQTLPLIAAGVVQTAPASRNNSASSITALPSLSSSLNNLHTATSLDHVEIVGTQTPEAEELVSGFDHTTSSLQRLTARNSFAE